MYIIVNLTCLRSVWQECFAKKIAAYNQRLIKT
jgi:hypothetical protein